jgi:hypothetical protein
VLAIIIGVVESDCVSVFDVVREGFPEDRLSVGDVDVGNTVCDDDSSTTSENDDVRSSSVCDNSSLSNVADDVGSTDNVGSTDDVVVN